MAVLVRVGVFVCLVCFAAAMPAPRMEGPAEPAAFLTEEEGLLVRSSTELTERSEEKVKELVLAFLGLVGMWIGMAAKSVDAAKTMDLINAEENVQRAMSSLNSKVKQYRSVLDQAVNDKTLLLRDHPNLERALEQLMPNADRSQENLIAKIERGTIDKRDIDEVQSHAVKEKLTTYAEAAAEQGLEAALGDAVPVVAFVLSIIGSARTFHSVATDPVYSTAGPDSEQMVAFIKRQEQNLELAFCSMITDLLVKGHQAAASLRSSSSPSSSSSSSSSDKQVLQMVSDHMVTELSRAWACRCASVWKERRADHHNFVSEITNLVLRRGSESANMNGHTVVKSESGISELNPDTYDPADGSKTKGITSPARAKFGIKLFTQTRLQEQTAKAESKEQAAQYPHVSDVVVVRRPCAPPETPEQDSNKLLQEELEAKGYLPVPFIDEAPPGSDVGDDIDKCHTIDGGRLDLNSGWDARFYRVFLYYKKSHKDNPVTDLHILSGEETPEETPGFTRIPISTNAHNGGLKAWWNDYTKFQPYLSMKVAFTHIPCAKEDEAWCGKAEGLRCNWVPLAHKGAWSKGYMVGVEKSIAYFVAKEKGKQAEDIICKDYIAKLDHGVLESQLVDTALTRERKIQLWIDGCFNGRADVERFEQDHRHAPAVDQFEPGQLPSRYSKVAQRPRQAQRASQRGALKGSHQLASQQSSHRRSPSSSSHSQQQQQHHGS